MANIPIFYREFLRLQAPLLLEKDNNDHLTPMDFGTILEITLSLLFMGARSKRELLKKRKLKPVVDHFSSPQGDLTYQGQTNPQSPVPADTG